ncbi:alkaline phosphatase [Alteraurantiacibacter palmitatis]|uniref:Alkaline phosphatase n=1 Tax=Alteraurantiacibacter palmitatis TaxID=2054628 RepID=A0ABV7E0K5_9SPHN
MSRPLLTATFCFSALLTVPALAQQASSTADYRAQGEAELADRLAAEERPEKARNVIIFIGDGMGVSTLTAARILAGQTAGVDGESYVTAMDRLDHTALVKTYSHDGQVSDSAPTATAILAGVKTRNGVIGVGPEAILDDCASGLANTVPSLLGLAQEAGFATGIVTTTKITHATPAAGYAHSPQRDWEADADMPAEAIAQGCRDIARQLVEAPVGQRLDVVLGGGRSAFLPANAADPEYPTSTGSRKDGRDLIAEWQRNHPGGTFVWSAGQLASYDPASGQPLLGLFEPSHMQYEADRAADTGGEPSLADMVELSIRRLSGKDGGYVLLVEGGRIDHAHHGGNAFRALTDAAALDAAVARALSLVDLDETLIVTTADHSHTLTISGYPARGNPILGTVAFGETVKARDGKGYTTLGYANGPGAVAGERTDPATQDTAAPDYRQQATVPLSGETHAGEDVAVRASGPSADLFRGTMEQQTIFYIIKRALFGDKPE